MPEEKCPEAARVQRETTGPCYWELGFHVQPFGRQFCDLFLHIGIATLTFQEGGLTFSVRRSINHQYIK